MYFSEISESDMTEIFRRGYVYTFKMSDWQIFGKVFTIDDRHFLYLVMKTCLAIITGIKRAQSIRNCIFMKHFLSNKI